LDSNPASDIDDRYPALPPLAKCVPRILTLTLTCPLRGPDPDSVDGFAEVIVLRWSFAPWRPSLLSSRTSRTAPVL